MPTEWPALPYDAWSATCDTLHAHTQVLGKVAAALAPPEPQLQHAALRLTARGWETAPLPARGGPRARDAERPPDQPVGRVPRGVLGAVKALGGSVKFDPTPQEVPWTVPLDEDD